MLVHIEMGQTQRSGERLSGNALASSCNEVEITFRRTDPDPSIVGGIYATDTDRQGGDEDNASVFADLQSAESVKGPGCSCGRRSSHSDRSNRRAISAKDTAHRARESRFECCLAPVVQS